VETTKILIAGDASVSRAFRERGRIFGKPEHQDRNNALVMIASSRTRRILAAFVIPCLLTPVTRMRNPRDRRNFVAQSTFRKFRPAEISVRARGVTETGQGNTLSCDRDEAEGGTEGI